MGPAVVDADAVNDFIDPWLIYAELMAIRGRLCGERKMARVFADVREAASNIPRVHVSERRRA